MLKASAGAFILPAALTYSRTWHFDKVPGIEVLGIYEQFRVLRDHQPGRTYVPMPKFDSGRFTGITKIGYFVTLEPVLYTGCDVCSAHDPSRVCLIRRLEFKSVGLEYGSIEKARFVCNVLNASTAEKFSCVSQT